MSVFCSLMIFFLVSLLLFAVVAGAIGVLVGSAVAGFEWAAKQFRGAR